MLAKRSSTIIAERSSGRMTYATKKPFAEHDLRVTLQRTGNKYTLAPHPRPQSLQSIWTFKKTG